MIGGIEAGGTKFVLAVGPTPTGIAARHVIPTRTPAETLAEAMEWFAGQASIEALGIASFGPVDLDLASPTWGHITRTPKPGWSDCDLAGHFARGLGVPVGFDTDVNGAAIAEAAHGAGRGVSSLAYVTVGTGIGGGLVLNGQPVHGAAHPEMGHVFVRRAVDDTDFAGHCPIHGDCLEGLASGPAIIARWGQLLSHLPPDHPAHERIAGYLAQLCYSLFAMTAAEVVVLGGGVTKAPGLLDRVREGAGALSNDYLPGGARHRIEAPGLGENSGLTGALMLAEAARAARS
ncbi:ROK family protein [Croceicoccus sp. BE223]|uniref:ROK family protein n=1 Tax=Croceicoccus sp. BE223 TaxID=2817716 RepID=UPI0028663034|nr:ROK family protein [Croceicoccus sp. BE223]MDR7102097.1 fructokinase [Croceicoccus sp. BE223]